jgi:hypothetical protein
MFRWWSRVSYQDQTTDLIESLQPAANTILVKLNVEQILHAHLDP